MSLWWENYLSLWLAWTVSIPKWVSILWHAACAPSDAKLLEGGVYIFSPPNEMRWIIIKVTIVMYWQSYQHQASLPDSITNQIRLSIDLSCNIIGIKYSIVCLILHIPLITPHLQEIHLFIVCTCHFFHIIKWPLNISVFEDIWYIWRHFTHLELTKIVTILSFNTEVNWVLTFSISKHIAWIEVLIFVQRILLTN